MLDLESIVTGVLATFRDDIQVRKATIKSSNLNFHVFANVNVLNQILGNLISNALKFTAPDVPPEIDLRAEQQGKFIRFWVCDSGIGIAPEHQERIFRAFERLHTTEAFPGTGIGLALVAKGAERLGGRVGVISSPNKGSCFWVDVPRTGKEKIGTHPVSQRFLPIRQS